MLPSISNIALPSFNHDDHLSMLKDIGFQGLEVAPSKVWEDTANVTFSKVASYRRQVEQAGLKVVGLHSLFFDQPGMGLFRGAVVRKKTLGFLVHLSQICVDLGGKILVFGSPGARKRNDLPVKAADDEAVSFFSELSDAVESHGTCFVIEALSKNESDYINSASHAMKITKRVDRKALKSHLDAKAVVDAGEATIDLFRNVSRDLVHFHANDPGVGILGETGRVDHVLLGKLLGEIGYGGYVSLEQRMVDPEDPMKPIKMSYSVLEKCYL